MSYFPEKLRTLFASFYRAFRWESPTDDDIDQMRSWSISCQLAAVPEAYYEQVPVEVAALIRAAKFLHPEMACGAEERDLRSEPCPNLG